MRLVRNLVKATAVLALVAAVLGGAAALGSSLFEEPPRDAAEFARKAEAARKADEERPRTRAERRYARRLNALCARQAVQLDRLGEEASSPLDLPAWVRKAKPVLRRHRAQLAALPAPRSLRKDLAALLELQASQLAAHQRLAGRLRDGDRAAFDELRPALARLDDRIAEAYVRLGGRACIRD